jgi:hypothetical protein
MESCRSCDGKIEATDNFCPGCGRSLSGQVLTASFDTRMLSMLSLLVVAVGFCMIPLSMSARLSVIFPLTSSLFIMGGLTVFVWSRCAAWWE